MLGKIGITIFRRSVPMAKDKKRREKTKRTLSSTQEVLYQHEFKLADRAGGYSDKRARN